MFPVEQPERAAFLEAFPVSHETVRKLDRYAELLGEWSQKFNLVAESTLPHIWQRHFLDSAQLLRHLPEKSGTLVDIGSGAGFPGLVLSIMGVSNIHLVESIGKKARFLQAVIDELGLGATLHHDRVENIKTIKADIITARAVGSLDDLLKLIKPIAKPETIGLFLKGKNIDSELTESKKSWTFVHQCLPSLSDDSGNILIVRHIKAKNDGRFQRIQKKHKPRPQS